MNKENRLGVSQSNFGVRANLNPETPFKSLANFNAAEGTNLGLEVLPHRLNWSGTFEGLSRKYKVEVLGVHGVLQPYPGILVKEAFRQLVEHQDTKEFVLDFIWLAGFGSEKGWESGLRRQHAKDMAKKLKAYLVMHPEVLGQVEDKIPGYTQAARTLIENGWREGGRAKLSWEPQTIREFADKHRLGTVLDTSHAARAEIDILTAWEVMRPEVIHLSDFKRAGHRPIEEIMIGKGDLTGKLRELVQEAKAKKGLILIIEVSLGKLPEGYDNLRRAIEFVETGQLPHPRAYSFPKKPTL